VQHEVSAVKVRPLCALNFELEIFRIKENTGVFLNLTVHAHIALLHQACADTACAETLAKEDVL
jgi:hypothetical protein